MQVGYNQKEPIRLGFSYVLAYQVHINSWSSFNTILTHSTPIPIPEPGFDPGIDIPPSPHHHHISTIPSHIMSTPSLSRQANSLSALSQGPQPLAMTDTLSRGKKRRTHLLSSLSETQERSIAVKSAYVSIHQPYTLQRFYMPTRLAILGV